MPKGQHDLSSHRITRHALERFSERFHVPIDSAEADLRSSLSRVRRLGHDPSNGADAYMGLHRGRVFVVIFQSTSCLTILTWPQFEPKLPSFGRPSLPRKRGRWLRRLSEDHPSPDPS